LGHAIRINRPFRGAALAAALGATLALGGCGGVEFQGAIFDAVGLSGDPNQQPDVKMSERPPLLVPPDTKALPQPGSGVAVATAREDWPQNPELQQNEIREAQKQAAVKERPDQTPLHPYIGKPTLFSKLLPTKEAPPPDDVPEPDPADKPKEGEGTTQQKPQPLKPHVAQELPNPAEDPFAPSAPDSYKNPKALY
jgi:hypothetical protein